MAQRDVFTSLLAGINFRNHKTSLTKRKAVSQLGSTSFRCVTQAEAEMTPGKMSLKCSP